MVCANTYIRNQITLRIFWDIDTAQIFVQHLRINDHINFVMNSWTGRNYHLRSVSLWLQTKYRYPIYSRAPFLSNFTIFLFTPFLLLLFVPVNRRNTCSDQYQKPEQCWSRSLLVNQLSATGYLLLLKSSEISQSPSILFFFFSKERNIIFSLMATVWSRNDDRSDCAYSQWTKVRVAAV